MSSTVQTNLIPIIPPNKNYWLVRTQSGRYYKEFRDKGFIGINWENITIEEINNSSHNELTNLVRKAYPEKVGPGRTASQLRTFVKGIKKGDTVVITGPASNRFSIGEVSEDDPYFVNIPPESIEENSRLCPFQKRKKVVWKKELHKWEMEMKFFKLLQHARNTISDANEYADLIEGLVHDFYIRGDMAQLILEVKKEGKIPFSSFFSMGGEIIELAHEFNQFSTSYKIDVDSMATEVNVNSPGKIKFGGFALSIVLLGTILVGISGGKIKVTFPLVGGGLELQIPGITQVVNDFLDHHSAREQKEMVLKAYMDQLEVKTPEELNRLFAGIEAEGSTVTQSTYEPASEVKNLENLDGGTSESE